MPHKTSKRRALLKLLPNMVTLASLCIGLTAIRFAIEEDMIRAVSLLLLAGFLDGVDGRLARYLHCSSEFGAQLDSLIDFVNFGVVPGFIIYVWINSMTDIYGLDFLLLVWHFV
jgi:CDP-diacylglycerol---serine O-phosphatidyltransferase